MIGRDYSVFDNLIEGVQVINQEWQYIYVNHAIIEQSKNTREGLLGNTMMEKYPGIENTDMFAHLKRCMKERVACNMVNKFNFPDGSKGWFNLRMQPIDDAVLIMSFDITNEKHQEAELLYLNEVLEDKVKERTKELFEGLEREIQLNKIKSAFVALASHEFRTPLTGIMLSVNLIETYMLKGDNENQSKQIKRIETIVLNLVDILDNFLAIDKLEQGNTQTTLEIFDIQILLRDIISELDGMNKSGQMICYTHEGEKDTMLDKKIIRNVIINLLSNAIKYSDEKIELDVKITEKVVRIAVKDYGIGIPEDQQKNMFNKFFRANNAREIQGTGLGLSIVKYYVSLLEGSIDFTSSEGLGTTFTVELPNNHQQIEKTSLELVS